MESPQPGSDYPGDFHIIIPEELMLFAQRNIWEDVIYDYTPHLTLYHIFHLCKGTIHMINVSPQSTSVRLYKRLLRKYGLISKLTSSFYWICKPEYECCIPTYENLVKAYPKRPQETNLSIQHPFWVKICIHAAFLNISWDEFLNVLIKRRELEFPRIPDIIELQHIYTRQQEMIQQLVHGDPDYESL